MKIEINTNTIWMSVRYFRSFGLLQPRCAGRLRPTKKVSLQVPDITQMAGQNPSHFSTGPQPRVDQTKTFHQAQTDLEGRENIEGKEHG